MHEKYREIFAKYGTIPIETGTKMLEQFKPWYIGMAHPFTLPMAVGGYDVPHMERWRRPEDDEVQRKPLFRTLGEYSLGGTPIRCEMSACACQERHVTPGPACRVKLFDITRGLPQRIEGQFRRH